MPAERMQAAVAEVSEHPGEHCQDCGVAYATVYRLPDDVWARITPSDNPFAGLLCLRCADQRAFDAGLFLYWTAERSEVPE